MLSEGRLVTNLEKLQKFMRPYYQTETDETMLSEYITTYTYPECAAAALWEELLGEAGLVNKGVESIDTGAEKFKYNAPTTVQDAIRMQIELYTERCNVLTGNCSSAIRVAKTAVGGISEDYYK